MDERKPASGLTGSEGLIAVGAVGLAAGVVLAYVAMFYARAIGDPRDWGAFGDYVGGLVNPICGLATAILVVLTLRATRAEAASTRELLQQQVAQMKRDAESLDRHRKLDGLLAEWNAHLDTPYQEARLGLDVHRTIAYTFHGTLGELFRDDVHLPSIQRAAPDDSYPTFSEVWRMNFNRSANLLREFARYCDEYDTGAGNQVLTEFYRHRLTWAARYMEAARQISPEVARALSAPWSHGDIGKVVRLPHPPAPFPDQAGPT